MTRVPALETFPGQQPSNRTTIQSRLSCCLPGERFRNFRQDCTLKPILSTSELLDSVNLSLSIATFADNRTGKSNSGAAQERFPTDRSCKVGFRPLGFFRI
jgi:hypothetical protein